MATSNSRDQQTRPRGVICGVCISHYQNPKVLPCFHVYCRDCIHLLRLKGQLSVIHCPECSKDFTLAEDNPGSLPDALHVHHKIDARSLSQQLESGELTCGLCKSARNSVNAQAFCTECNEHLCAGCIARHSEPDNEEFSGHRVITFQDLFASGQHGDTSKHHAVVKRQRASTFNSRCATHRGKELAYYCKDCSQLICEACQLSLHRGHIYNHYSYEAGDAKREVEKSLPSIRLHHKRMAASIDEITKTRQEIEEQRQHISDTIDTAFVRLANILERHRKRLQESLAERVEAKLQHLSRQQTELRIGKEELARQSIFTEESLEMCTEQEMLLMFKFLHNRIKETTQHYSRMNVEPCELPNLALSVTCTQQISDACQKHAKLYTREANPLACEVQGAGLLSAEVKHEAHFTVLAQDKAQSPCSALQDVRVSIKCLSNDLKSDATVNEQGQGTYLVSYTPVYRGTHEIIVRVNDEPIRGSPFTTHVKYPPSMLGRSHGMINDIKSPRGIVAKPGGGLFVTEYNGHQVVELDNVGRKVKTYGNGVLRNPTSIAADTAGHLYVVDSAREKSCIIKMSPDGEVVSVVGREGGAKAEFKNPRGVALSRQNELYVCDRDNHRIQVFDSNLQFLRCLNLDPSDPLLKKAVKPNDVAFDTTGKMYVVDCANNCVLLFTSAHCYLGSFGTKGEGVGKLCTPECVHVNNSLVYITEYRGKRQRNLSVSDMQSHDDTSLTSSCDYHVSVFRINGDFVTRFGTSGSQEDQLKFPMGIATDENGVVYICDFFNNRIQLF